VDITKDIIFQSLFQQNFPRLPQEHTNPPFSKTHQFRCIKLPKFPHHLSRFIDWNLCYLRKSPTHARINHVHVHYIISDKSHQQLKFWDRGKKIIRKKLNFSVFFSCQLRKNIRHAQTHNVKNVRRLSTITILWV
jgi:hypothetical protein